MHPHTHTRGSPVERDDSLRTAEVDETARDARVLENISQQRRNESVEEVLRCWDTELGVQHHAGIFEFLSDRVVPAVQGTVG